MSFFFIGTNETVRHIRVFCIKGVSIERASTVSDTYTNFVVLCSFMSIMKYS